MSLTCQVLKSAALLLCLYSSCTRGDEVDLGARTTGVRKLLREMVNQTQADTLNLPANASSIRENITDTFSCENRTYGYYADVDNECQVFHVCLPTQAASGHNVTYRWSFICPQETVFNQEVLVCTYPRDSIDCEESPNYYDLNMEIGKTPNNTNNGTKSEVNMVPDAERISIKNNKRHNNRKKQNLIVESLIEKVMNGETEDLAELADELEITIPQADEKFVKKTDDEETKNKENFESNFEFDDSLNSFKFPTKSFSKEHELSDRNKGMDVTSNVDKDTKEFRLVSERSLKRKGRKLKRGSIRYHNL